MNKEFKIDYLQFTASRHPDWIRDPIDDLKKPSSMRFYKYMTRYKSGASMHEGNPNTDKPLFILPGKACDTYQVTRSEWLASLVSDGASVSRIDLAMTCDEKILDKFVKGAPDIVSRKFSTMKIISDAQYTPQTVYCGDMKRRGRNGIVRAYDKAFQLELPENIVLQRIEVELKRKDAMVATARIAHGESIASVMNSKFMINKKWYRDIFGDGISTKRFAIPHDDILPEIDRKMVWLERQVIPSLQYVIDYDKDNGTSNFARLLDQLKF